MSHHPSSPRGARPLSSSADLYAQVPTSDSTYPPIRSITPRSPEVVNPPYASTAAIPPGLANPAGTASSPNWLHERSPSTATFESQYSDAGVPAGAAGAGVGAGAGRQPYRLHGGAATQSGTWDDAATGHSYSPEGSQANLMGLAAGGAGSGGVYLGVPTGAGSRNDSYSKEYASAEALGGAGAGGGLATLRKGGHGGGKGAGGAGGWWSRQSSRSRKLLIVGLVLLVLVIAAAVAIPVGIIKSRDNSGEAQRKADNDGTEQGIPTEVNPAPDWKTAAYGGNGSVVYLEDGSSFRYNNSFGASWPSSRRTPDHTD